MKELALIAVLIIIAALFWTSSIRSELRGDGHFVRSSPTRLLIMVLWIVGATVAFFSVFVTYLLVEQNTENRFAALIATVIIAAAFVRLAIFGLKKSDELLARRNRARELRDSRRS